ncbi:MAG: thiamine diphosphokinase [Oscillospiraceae bacterium]
MSDCYIIGGANIGNYDFVTIPKGSFVIAADSGVSHLGGFKVKPDIIMGDFDSCSVPTCYDCEILRFKPEKDDTDLMLAAKKALSLGYKRIFFLGATGGRLDHTVAAFQTLEYICEHGADGAILDENNAVYIQDIGKKRYKADKCCYFSVFSLSDEAKVTISGTKYEVTEQKIVRSFPLGVSNEFSDEFAEIEVLDGKILVIYSKRDIL